MTGHLQEVSTSLPRRKALRHRRDCKGKRKPKQSEEQLVGTNETNHPSYQRLHIDFAYIRTWATAGFVSSHHVGDLLVADSAETDWQRIIGDRNVKIT
jgi:hypothetical protein